MMLSWRQSCSAWRTQPWALVVGGWTRCYLAGLVRKERKVDSGQMGDAFPVWEKRAWRQIMLWTKEASKSPPVGVREWGVGQWVLPGNTWPQEEAEGTFQWLKTLVVKCVYWQWILHWAKRVQPFVRWWECHSSALWFNFQQSQICALCGWICQIFHLLGLNIWGNKLIGRSTKSVHLNAGRSLLNTFGSEVLLVGENKTWMLSFLEMLLHLWADRLKQRSYLLNTGSEALH